MLMLGSTWGSAASVVLGERLGGGGEGRVHVLESPDTLAAKAYLPAHRTPKRRAKIEAMIATPPSPTSMPINGVDTPLLAWPTNVLTEDDGSFAGFVMARVPPQFVALEHFLRAGRSLGKTPIDAADRSLTSRLAGTRNLARLVQSVHERGHLVVDLNAPNIRVQRKTMVVCIMDCDSFAIARNGRIQFPASAMRADGLAPEFQGRPLETLRFDSEGQDRFALAVLIFQWLNRGIHPFQGRRKAPDEPDATEQHTLQNLIEQRQYGYGMSAHAEIVPMANSDHDLFPIELRQLFDRAFASTAPNDRPSAKEWSRTLGALNSEKHVRRCKRAPDNVLHIHFAGGACLGCRSDERRAAAAASESAPPGRWSSSIPPASAPAAAASAPAVSPPAARATTGKISESISARRRAAAGVAVAVALLVAWLWLVPDRAAITPHSTAPAPEAAAPASAHTAPDANGKALAQTMSQPDDEAGLRARSELLETAVAAAERDNLQALLQWSRQAVGAPLPDLEQRARAREPSQAHLQPLSAWNRFRKAARELHARALAASTAQDDRTATALARDALALDPLDVEIAGNLAEFEARAGNHAAALAALSYAMALRRQNTGRSADWQLFGNLQALDGNGDVAEGAYTVALAITPRPQGLCSNMQRAVKRWGPALRAPLTLVAARFEELAAPGGECAVH